MLVLYLTQQTKQTKVMRYNNKQEKAKQVAELTANVPVGTRMDVMRKGADASLISQCVVEKVTKSGNIVLRSVSAGSLQDQVPFPKVEP